LASIKIIHCDAEWFGVTYQKDKAMVIERLASVQSFNK